jgi:6-pyruvoyltetrahydropterin/6-carboxytetrahydropterin synthase
LFTTHRDYAFSASHRIDDLPDEHPCGRLHGHNYVARVEFSGEFTDDTGWLIDWMDLAAFDEYIGAFLEHRHLNSVIDAMPTAENVATFLLDLLMRTCDIDDDLTIRIGVSETPDSWAWVTSE